MPAQILVVDDQADITTWIRLAFEAQGWGVATCNDGERAVAACSAVKFDLIVLDVAMPFMNGFEAAAHIRKSGSSVPIIFHSAHLSQEDEARVKEYEPATAVSKTETKGLIVEAKRVLMPVIEAEKIIPPPLSSGDRRKKERPEAPLWAVILICLVAASFTASMVQVVRGLYTFGMVAQTYSYVRESTRPQRGGQVLEARIPPTLGALPPALRDGSQDVTFRVCPEDAAKVRQLASKRGVRLRVEVR